MRGIKHLSYTAHPDDFRDGDFGGFDCRCVYSVWWGTDACTFADLGNTQFILTPDFCDGGVDGDLLFLGMGRDS